MKKPIFDIPTFFTALRTTGALVAGNGVVQLVLEAPVRVVLELLVTGFVVIVLTSFTGRK